MTEFCLSIPGLNTGLKDAAGLTAFDLSCRHEDEHETLPTLFYGSMMDMEKRDPDGALLQLLTLSSEPEEEGPVFPGVAIFGPVVRNNLPLVVALMEVGVDVTTTNEDQETALHLAAKEGHAEIVGVLLVNSSRGEMFDVAAVAKDGLTPLHYAALCGHQGVAQVLLGHGANKTVKDALGRTPLNCALEKKHVLVQEILDTMVDEQTDLELESESENTNCPIDPEYWENRNSAFRETPDLEVNDEDIESVTLHSEPNVNAKDDGGCGELHRAAEAGKIREVNTARPGSRAGSYQQGWDYGITQGGVKWSISDCSVSARPRCGY